MSSKHQKFDKTGCLFLPHIMHSTILDSKKSVFKLLIVLRMLLSRLPNYKIAANFYKFPYGIEHSFVLKRINNLRSL